MRGIEDHARGPEIDFQWIDRAGFQEVFLLEAVAEAGANGSFTLAQEFIVIHYYSGTQHRFPRRC